MEESVYMITSVTLQIRNFFASYPPKDALGSSYLIRLQKKNYSEKENLERSWLRVYYTMS